MQYYEAVKKRPKLSLVLNFWLRLFYVLLCVIMLCNMYSNVNML